MTTSMQLPIRIRDRFVLRRSTRADADALSRFYAGVFKDEDGNPEMTFVPWVNDFLNGRHPTFGEGDFTIVEEIASGQIVSAMNLISQTWTYAGIEIPAGRPECVGTGEAYRNQGLVRAQFEVVHAWSQARGEMIQGITGIPYYYRLFGYEMCVDLFGGWIGYRGSLPRLEEGQAGRYTIRPAEERDLAFLTRLNRQASERLLLTCPRDERLWHWEIFGYSPGVDDARQVRIIEDRSAGRPLGYLLHDQRLRSDGEDSNILSCTGYELNPGVSYLEVTPVVLDYLWRMGEEYGRQRGRPCGGVGFFFEDAHPAMQVARSWLPRRREPYAWYIRVPDLPAFLRRVAPAVESSLANSGCAGHSGRLDISLYTSRLSLEFQEGRLVGVQQNRHFGETGCSAAFPGQTFLHLVFGYRTLAELEYVLPDCWAEGSARPLLEALFPRRPSNIWPIS